MENKKVLKVSTDLDNEALEQAMRAFLAEKTNENMAKLMETMKEARFLVPADFPPEIKKEVIERAKRGEKVNAQIAPRMLPIIVQNKEGEFFAPAYTTRKEFLKLDQYPAILNVTMAELLRIASEPKLNLKGIIVNPDSDKMILHPKFIDAMKQYRAGNGQPKEIKMTKEQFELFARKNCEWVSIPKAVYTQNAEFMKKLDEERGQFMYALYRQPYGDKIPCPYSEKDFDVMVLNVDENTCVASIELPKQNMAVQMAHSLYIVWDPKTDEMHYFTIEQGQPGQENVLCGIGSDGTREELQTAPPAGSEIAAILDLIREEKEEAQEA